MTLTQRLTTAAYASGVIAWAAYVLGVDSLVIAGIISAAVAGIWRTVVTQ